MGKVHIEPITYVARFFEDGLGYGDPYIGSMVLQICGRRAYCQAYHGKHTRSHHIELRDQLLALGVTELVTERHGKERTYTR